MGPGQASPPTSAKQMPSHCQLQPAPKSGVHSPALAAAAECPNPTPGNSEDHPQVHMEAQSLGSPPMEELLGHCQIPDYSQLRGQPGSVLRPSAQCMTPPHSLCAIIKGQLPLA